MRLSRFIHILAVISLVLAALGTAYTPATAQGGTPDFDRDIPYVPGELVVRYGRNVSRSIAYASAVETAKDLGGDVVQNVTNSSLLSFSEDADLEVLAQEIALEPGVVSVEPNYIRWIPEVNPGGQSHTIDSVKFRSKDGKSRTIAMQQLKAMRTAKKVNGKIKAVPSYPVEYYDQWGWWWSTTDVIWPEKAVSPGVCVIDTGVDANHPDLIGKVVNGYDFVNDDALPNDDNGHGTHVAGTIAALMNNKKGLSGISNGKVIAVKVLTAQGWGTSWNIAQGIEYCANRADVKVINMSIGGPSASGLEFDALTYATTATTQTIVGGPYNGFKGRGKLVVVAAGNETTSEFSFPAAWAAFFVCDDGSSTFPVPCASNTVYQGMLSVGAGANPYWDDDPDDADFNDDGYLWVDTDGNGFEPSDGDPDFFDEHFDLDQCAADFSNYGAWVDIIAPGEDILSTLPVSYPFYDEYYYDEDFDNDGYEWYSGTSMAAPHVAAGAARTWSVFPTSTNAAIKTQLLATGDTWIEFAMDPNMSDPAAGYLDGGYNGEAPYCWPDNSFGGQYDTSAAVYLNVAAAMNRGGIFADVYDAINGLPLKGAMVKAFLGATLKDQSVLTYDWSPYADLLNLPGGATVNVKVNKAGYTYGDQVIGSQVVSAGTFEWGPQLIVGVPPNNKRIHAVANWDGFEDDLDFFTWVPDVSGPGIIVGPWDPDADINDYLDEGDLNDVPFARWNRDGGSTDWLTMESISIAPKPGTTNIPYYNRTVDDYYDFFLTDYYQPGLLNEEVFVRVWVNGKIIATVAKSDSCDTDGLNDTPGDIDDEVWWWVGWMNGPSFVAEDQCGTGEVAGTTPEAVWPYRIHSRNSSTSGIPENSDSNK